MNPQEAAALRAVIDAILDAVAAGGTRGAPAGIMYAALMTHGCTLDQFNMITGAICRAGLIRRDGDLFHMLPKGEERRQARAVA